jgi:protein required for attachment to host cells
MENTKRMVLVDEKMLDVTSALQAKQDMSWNRPSDQTVKSNINKQMKSTLDDQSIPEDVKAKQYRQQLNRFLQTKRKLPTVNEFRTKRQVTDRRRVVGRQATEARQRVFGYKAG